MKQISILIADDHTLIRQSCAFLLAAHSRFCVVGESGTGSKPLNIPAGSAPTLY